MAIANNKNMKKPNVGPNSKVIASERNSSANGPRNPETKHVRWELNRDIAPQ